MLHLVRTQPFCIPGDRSNLCNPRRQERPSTAAAVFDFQTSSHEGERGALISPYLVVRPAYSYVRARRSLPQKWRNSRRSLRHEKRQRLLLRATFGTSQWTVSLLLMPLHRGVLLFLMCTVV